MARRKFSWAAWLFAAFVLLSLAVAPALAQPKQPKSIDPPKKGRPPDFSNIVGKYMIEVAAAPTEVHVEDAIRLEVRIIGVGPEKYEPHRKDLRLFPSAWGKDFYVQELRDEHKVLRDDKTWLFVYRLKPKHLQIKAIDGIKFICFDPAYGEEKGFITIAVDPISLTVKPKVDQPSEIELPDAFAALASFYEISQVDVLATPEAPVGIAYWHAAIVLAIAPILCVIIAFAYRRSFPDAAAQLQRIRTSAAERALSELRTSTVPAAVVVGYLRDRLDFAGAAPTPAEVARFLDQRGFDRALCEQARQFFAACDRVRFATGSNEDASLNQQAAQLVKALENARCIAS